VTAAVVTEGRAPTRPTGAFGIRPEARAAWRALVAVLVELDTMGVRTPCDQDPSAFVDDDAEVRRQAAKLCSLCPIRSQCGGFAAANRETVGVWAGKDRTWGAGVELANRGGRTSQATPHRPTHAQRPEDEPTFTDTTGETR